MNPQVVVCKSCQKKCSADAALCPHCGTQQRFDDGVSLPTDRFFRPGPKQEDPSFTKNKSASRTSMNEVKYSAEELAALVSSSPSAVRKRSFGSFLLPHPGLLGRDRLIERVLLVLMVPLFAGAATSLYAHSSRMMRRFGEETEFRLNLSLIFGGAPVAWWLTDLALGSGPAIALVTTSSVAVLLRGALRGTADWDV
ncbi:MAG: hypothetical protein GY822_21775 [Deltaproteobacteria bacterium]|nr:hypothetical protein [Deltaproteobacteria bacterium]